MSDGRKDSAIADDLGLDKGHYSRMKSGTATLPFYLVCRLRPAEWLRLRAELDKHYGTGTEAEQTDVLLDQVMAAIEGLVTAAKLARKAPR